MIRPLRGAAHVLVFGFTAIWMELAFGRLNFWLPCGFLFSFYLAASRGWRFAACWSSFAAVVLSDLGGYISFPGFCVAVAFGQIWRRHGERSRLLVQIFPALVFLFLAEGITLGIEHAHHHSQHLQEDFLSFLCSIGSGALAFPILLLIWDGCAERLGLPAYDSGVESHA